MEVKMPQKCTVCAHAEAAMINKQLLVQVPLRTLSEAYEVTVASLQRHQKHIPAQLVRAQEAREVAAADVLIGRVADLNIKAEDVYKRALKADNLSVAIGAIRELRGILELYAKITGELSSVNNIIIAPEWVSLRSVLLMALEPYPVARKAVLEAVGRMGA
jgi:hypothetical protein